MADVQDHISEEVTWDTDASLYADSNGGAEGRCLLVLCAGLLCPTARRWVSAFGPTTAEVNLWAVVLTQVAMPWTGLVS